MAHAVAVLLQLEHAAPRSSAASQIWLTVNSSINTHAVAALLHSIHAKD
jgi:hypothetical protein